MRLTVAALLWLLILVSPAAHAAAAAEPLKAKGSVQLKDAAGDMGPTQTSSGAQAPLDVVLLEVSSDGTRITFSATLKDPPGWAADAVVEVRIDADNDPATGTRARVPRDPAGFEYEADLRLCVTYDDESEACVGGSASGNPTSRYAAVTVSRYTGEDAYSGEDRLVDAMGFFAPKKAVRVPVKASVVSAGMDYADIGAKPGQTIRLFARETGGSAKDEGAFPLVLLTLK
jgi:hypothetical protein